MGDCQLSCRDFNGSTETIRGVEGQDSGRGLGQNASTIELGKIAQGARLGVESDEGPGGTDVAAGHVQRAASERNGVRLGAEAVGVLDVTADREGARTCDIDGRGGGVMGVQGGGTHREVHRSGQGQGTGADVERGEGRVDGHRSVRRGILSPHRKGSVHRGGAAGDIDDRIRIASVRETRSDGVRAHRQRVDSNGSAADVQGRDGITGRISGYQQDGVGGHGQRGDGAGTPTEGHGAGRITRGARRSRSVSDSDRGGV